MKKFLLLTSLLYSATFFSSTFESIAGEHMSDMVYSDMIHAVLLASTDDMKNLNGEIYGDKIIQQQQRELQRYRDLQNEREAIVQDYYLLSYAPDQYNAFKENYIAQQKNIEQTAAKPNQPTILSIITSPTVLISIRTPLSPTNDLTFCQYLRQLNHKASEKIDQGIVSIEQKWDILQPKLQHNYYQGVGIFSEFKRGLDPVIGKFIADLRIWLSNLNKTPAPFTQPRSNNSKQSSCGHNNQPKNQSHF